MGCQHDGRVYGYVSIGGISINPSEPYEIINIDTVFSKTSFYKHRLRIQEWINL